MNILIIHHNDGDGFGSWAIASAKLSNINKKANIISHVWSYHMDFDEKILERENWDKVYILDLHLPNMSELFTKYPLDVTIVDHHITFADSEDANRLKEMDNIELITSNMYPGFSACEITWAIFNDEPDSPNMPIPLRAIGRYDVWDHSGRFISWDDINIYCKGIMGVIDSYDVDESKSEKWVKYFGEKMILDDITRFEWERKYYSFGKPIYNYEEEKYKSIGKRLTFEVEFEGLIFIAANIDEHTSKPMSYVTDYTKHDAQMRFSLNRNMRWHFSMYTEKEGVDVSIIAAKYGGGGHKGACGFVLEYEEGVNLINKIVSPLVKRYKK